jgi:hypothetical protein
LKEILYSISPLVQGTCLYLLDWRDFWQVFESTQPGFLSCSFLALAFPFFCLRLELVFSVAGVRLIHWLALMT